MNDRKKYPTEEVEPENFLDNDEVMRLLETRENYDFKQEDFLKLLNCVHCNACGTSEERCQLNHKFLEDGNEIEGLAEMIASFGKYGTPYSTDKMRIRRPEGILEDSKTLYYMGCLSTIRVPRFTENSLKYLIKHNINFTILDKEICCGYPLYVSGAFEQYEKCKKENVEIFKHYEKIICACPACYYVFKDHYQEDVDAEISFVVDYLKPTDSMKTGKVTVQHLCQLMNRGRPEVTQFVNDVLQESGYEVLDVPHWCCGGGIGYMHRLDIIDKIAQIRMGDFNKGDYCTTYCVSCWWILSRFGRKYKITPKPKDIFELLI
ncbi:MAG: heterodisulfide reductase-related iron-sulfur binding cluster [Candidatus Hodarchaeota archaeon]